MSDSLLKIIADNPALFDEVKRVFREAFSLNADFVHGQATNEVLGQALRARIDGLVQIEKAFLEIEKCRSIQPTPPRQNPAE